MGTSDFEISSLEDLEFISLEEVDDFSSCDLLHLLELLELNMDGKICLNIVLYKSFPY